MTLPITAWDSTPLEVAHRSPGPTHVTRLGVTLEAFITQREQLLIPADMDPTSPWAVEARTGELTNLLAAKAALTRNWPLYGAALSYAGIDPSPHGPLYRWEVWNGDGMLIDLIRTATHGWTMKTLHTELRQAGWIASAGAADPFTPYPDHRTWTDNHAIRIRPGKPFRWLVPSGGNRTRRWPLTDAQVTAAQTHCRTLGTAALRAVAAHTDDTRYDAQREQARAALVGVVDRHLTRPTFTDHPDTLCSCPTLPDTERNPTSHHHPACACHEPQLLRHAALHRLHTLTHPTADHHV